MYFKPGMVAYSFNLSTQEVEVRLAWSTEQVQASQDHIMRLKKRRHRGEERLWDESSSQAGNLKFG